MAKTVNASKAAELLGIDPKTLRKRLSSRYRGAGKIVGAVKKGKDWEIPLAAIQEQLFGAKGKGKWLPGTSPKNSDFVELLSHVYFGEAGKAEQRLVEACRQFADPDTGGSAKLLNEVRTALRELDKNEYVVEFMARVRKELAGPQGRQWWVDL